MQTSFRLFHRIVCPFYELSLSVQFILPERPRRPHGIARLPSAAFPIPAIGVVAQRIILSVANRARRWRVSCMNRPCGRDDVPIVKEQA
jgi:hypothetical protein